MGQGGATLAAGTRAVTLLAGSTSRSRRKWLCCGAAEEYADLHGQPTVGGAQRLRSLLFTHFLK